MSSGVASVKERAGLPANGHQPNGNPPVKHEEWLVKYQNEIKRALPRHMTPDRMARIALTELRRVPKLMECNPRSFFGAVIQASQLGLEPGSGLGHAYLVPYKNECQLIIGYRGMIDLARRSGNLVSITARVVHAKDDFSYSYGLDETLKHVPSTDPDPGQLVYVYGVARLKDGGVQFEVMSKGEVDKIRARSKSSSSGPWVTDYDAMARKTVIRRLWKYLPTSVEMQKVESLENDADEGISQGNDFLLAGEAPPTAGEEVVDAAGEILPVTGEAFNLGDDK
jgi:recombination protein RecT